MMSGNNPEAGKPDEGATANRTARGDSQAVRLNGMFSILFSFAELTGWRPEDSNPCTRLKVSIPKGRTRVAGWPELDAILDAATTTGLHSIGTAALLSALQGQRETDIIEATCGLFSQITVPADTTQQMVWAWRVDRSKRGTLGLMPLHPIVLDRVLALLDGRDPGVRLLTDERTGRDYDEHLFQSRWQTVRREASKHAPTLTGADQLQFRDLRRTFAVWAKAGGSSDDDVGDVLGNTAALDPRLQETYMPPSFATASRAVLSIERPLVGGKKHVWR
jgi:integrase